MRSKALHILSILLLLLGTPMTTKAQIPDPTTVKPVSKIKIIGNVYGGGDQAAVQGNTTVVINKGQFGGDIFGGGNGSTETDGEGNAIVKVSADVGMHNDDGTLKEGTGDTHVTINGGEVFYDDDHPSNHNVYGGGNLACNVAGDTYVEMNKGIVTNWTFYSNITTVLPEWYKWYDQAMNPNTQKTPIVAVFGAGYGAHTDVAGDTHVKVDFKSSAEINPTDGESFTHEELEKIDEVIMRWMPDHRLVEQFVSAVHGGGYDGTVGAYDAETYKTNPSTGGINYDKTSYTSQINVTIQGQPFIFDVYGGGLGSKTGADANGNVNSHVGAVYGATKVDIHGGIINGDVFGGGAGIAGQHEIPNPFPGAMGGSTVNLPYTYAAQVMRETDVTIDGKSTVIFGNVYGGGDIANTGWHVGGSRPTMEGHVANNIQNLVYLDYTTSINLNGGNILGNVFGGGNGRKKADVEQYKFIGSVIGSTNVTLNGSSIWGDIYGGGNTGCIYSCQTIAGTQGEVGRPMATVGTTTVTDGCTNVSILKGKVARNIFGGGFGDDPTGHEEGISSADISGNTYVYFKEAELEYEKYWKPREVATQDAMGSTDNPYGEKTGHFLDQSSSGEYRNSESDITHNLYGGGNMACTVLGHSHVVMDSAPIAPLGFSSTDYYKDCIANVAKPHFSVFGGGYGAFAKIAKNAYSDINLEKGSGLHSIVGGGMNGPVGGLCQVHVGSNPQSLIHYVYGGGYYAPCSSTLLEITRGNILENVFGGAVMGNINENGAPTDVATRTVIGLQTPGDGRHSSITLKDENNTVLTEYTYDQHQNQIIIGGDVYGANDVSGTVNGIASLAIYGGTIKGNVYGAGNGDHIGYYVPNELRYDLGTHYENYFFVDHHAKGAAGNTYVGRPQTIGGVELTLEGNTKDERVKVLGQVFGGGNSCTIGEWDKTMLALEGKYHGNPHLTRDDPAYFLGGGRLDINLHSHVTIGRTHTQLSKDTDGEYYISDGENVSGLFMGCSGRNLATQNGAMVNNYYHHYFDARTQRYYPGFAVQDETGKPMDREEQLKPFQAYLNNIMIWSDDVHLNIPDDAEDIWLANFVGGGFRGSMRTKLLSGKFDYTLPEGVTVSHAIVGGAYNAHVQYHYFDTDADGNFTDTDNDGIYDYATSIPEGWTEGTDYVRVEYTDEEHKDNDHIKSIIRYNYNGGMLSENSTGVNSSEVGHHIHQVHADPRENGITDEERNARYATSYFEPIPEGNPGAEDDATRAKLFTANKSKVLLHLDLRCALEPEVFENSVGNKNAHGGNVFGGCFLSGFVEGDSWVDYNCWLSPESNDPYFFDKSNNMHIYGEVADIERNNAMSVYGAGYGTDTHSDGDVYLYIKALNQTAGSDSDRNGHFPYIFNAFGGSNMGTVAGNTNVYFAIGKQGTLLGSLYGGGYKGDIEGNTFVELAEGFATNVYGGSRQANIKGASHVWAYDGKFRGINDANHLIVCNLYGGNDIAGTISGEMPATFTTSKWDACSKREKITGKTFNTYVEISADDASANRGFPLIGSAYAGGNGVNWTELDGLKPEVGTVLLEIDGGSTLRAFGGGNMATVTKDTYIFTDAKSTDFANVTFADYQKNIVNKIFFSGVKTGYKWDGNTLKMDPFHVAALFGGNNLATMDIQPTWNLHQGRLENVYSGGNMGDMTYYNPAGKPATKDGTIGAAPGVETLNTDGSNSNYTPRGLSITIDQPDIFIGSLFGGCRMSNVNPTPKADQEPWPEGTDGEDFYGATVNITDGYIDNVYGGNDISGIVHHGTNVNISGAVSGNVYGSGNGFYLYKYDPDVTQVTEEFDDEYGIYYRVPENDKNGNPYDTRGELNTDTHKLLTINGVRPSVEKAFLNIAGLEHYPAGAGNPKRVAYVKGNVFCGGNASTITGNESFSKFKIGSYVTLNGVFMGSDGLAFTKNEEIARFAKINEFADMGAATNFKAEFADDQQHNPILLNAYMMAVDMKAQPKDFNLNLPLKEAHIGTYCGGGNRGSMLVDKTVSLPFHHDIIIYDKIVAACLDANVKYNQNGKIITSYGGYTRDISDHETYGNTKMKLDIASQFVPLVMDVPDNKNPETKNRHGETFAQALAHDFLYDNRTSEVKYTYEEFNSLFETKYTSQEEFESTEGLQNQWKNGKDIYAPSCNIYGGCYQSGEVEGDIVLNVYSNMLRYVNKENLQKSIEKNIACFNVYGAGFGQDSHVWGNVTINMDRSTDTSTMGTLGQTTLSSALQERLGEASNWNILNQPYNPGTPSLDCSYPSFNNVIGGGRNGKLIGNTTVAIRNGLVFTDVAGGCYASDMYGSTHVIVGYPKYYECLKSGEYTLARGDTWNTGKKDVDGNDVIKKSIRYLKGDLVPDNIYQQITSKSSTDFKEATVTRSNWDDVHIKIGKGVYGGGYSLANSTAASAGSITTHKLADDETTTKDIHPHNFNSRYGYDDDITSTVGYGGNSSIMVGDQTGGTRDHISISTLIAKKVTNKTGSTMGKFLLEADGKYTHQGDGAYGSGDYYELSGDGGIYGDGHLTFCEAFRAADVTNYGYADGTPQYPVLMNTFQRMDLLSVNDCCLMLQGAQDFATDQIDATLYSITRVNELRMNSTLDPTLKLGEISSQTSGNGTGFNLKRQRNYLAFFNNVHYLGSLVTNDDFSPSSHTLHNEKGDLVNGKTYRTNKEDYITAYHGSNKDAAATAEFKKRNVATARNAIGVNNGYCLRIQNQEYVGSNDARQSKTYYGPIVGVCEIKLLTLMQGEGGGYVYADNIHADENFLNTSGNFVFPGVVNTDPSIGDQYIVDDCFLDHFGTPEDLTTKNGDLDEAHYWYVEGNKYFFNTTLTGFTYQDPLDFNLIENDPNIILSGMEKNSQLNIKKIEWLGQHRNGYQAVLPNGQTSPEKTDDYEFDIEIGGSATWTNDMPRHTAGSDTTPLTSGKTIPDSKLPQFNIRLQDKLDNSGDANYINHLDEPELVKIYLEGKTLNGGTWQNYEYTITLNIVYLQGPTFEGGVVIENCALPGEQIAFSTNGLKIKTPELMPVTSHAWKIVPLSEITSDGEWKWDMNNGIVIPEEWYSENANGNISGTIPALYKQNEYNIAYVFTAGGHEFPVIPNQQISVNPKKERRMIVVHNYHRMKDVIPYDLQIESMPQVTVENSTTPHVCAEAKLYIEDEADLRAFIEYLNMATESNAKNIPVGLTGLDVILQKDIKLTSELPAISQAFAGTFHGDGYHIDLNGKQTTLLGDKLTGKVYNLGLIAAKDATIASTGTITNCYVSGNVDANNLQYGRKAYELSHTFTPTTDAVSDASAFDHYVATRYANGDYQYATTDRIWSLRTGAPYYGHTDTHHNTEHTHDAARWHDADDESSVDILSEQGQNIPLYDGRATVDDRIVMSDNGLEQTVYYGLPLGYANDYLFFGQHLDKTDSDAYPVHIDQVAKGDADKSKGGNRVFETAGYYLSKTDEQFYYNKDAWALYPELTAIDYTHMTAEGDNANTLPTKFSVDSNKDYDEDGKPISATSDPAYTNKSYGHVTQNLLVYNNGEVVFTEKDVADIKEKDVVYHNIVKGTDKYATDYLHLVDRQDFNAPIAFDVKTRAWYERQPQAYRNVTTLGYDSGSAWEGIVLPFTATKVTAEKNGEISHFYGAVPAEGINDKDLRHEYWLRGFKGISAGGSTTTATFAHPAISGSGNDYFIDSRQAGVSYEYPKNDYFTSLFNYNPHYDTRDDEGDDTMDHHDKAWYAESHTFTDYVPLTASVPYIVAFPGDDFYEFSMESYYKTDKYGSTSYPQMATFETGTTTIGITGTDSDLRQGSIVATSAGNYAHHGTYQHALSEYGINEAGTAFEKGQTIVPFRTYMTVTSSAKPRLIAIFEGDTELAPDAPDSPAEELGAKSLKIYLSGNTLMIDSNYATDLKVFYPSGQYVRTLHVESGTNEYHDLHKGLYIIGTKKLMIP